MPLTKEQIDGIVETLSPIIPELVKELEKMESESKD